MRKLLRILEVKTFIHGAFPQAQDRGAVGVPGGSTESEALGGTVGTANEAPGPATLASPHSRLAWLPARQHCLEGSGPLRPWELGAGPLFYESLGLCV